MPNRMPDKISEDISNIMSEDLPIKTYKNIIIKILQNKIIILFYN